MHVQAEDKIECVYLKEIVSIDIVSNVFCQFWFYYSVRLAEKSYS